jgi:segregation and condensation protein B
MSIKAKIEAIVYAAEEPVTVEQILALLKDEDEARPDVQGVLRVPEATAPLAVENLPAGLPEGDQQPSAPAIPGESAPDSPGETPASSPQLMPVPDKPGPVSDAEFKTAVRAALAELVDLYSSPEHGIEVRQIAGGYRMATKPEQHDIVRSFARSLKPPIRLSLPALETLAVIAYKQPITAPEITEIRGVDAGGVLGTLLDRKLITTGGRKQVIGRPILYKTTKEFLLRFGLKGLEELPSMEEFEKLAAESFGADLLGTALPEPAAEPTTPPSSPEADQDATEDPLPEDAEAPDQDAAPEETPPGS